MCVCVDTVLEYDLLGSTRSLELKERLDIAPGQHAALMSIIYDADVEEISFRANYYMGTRTIIWASR